MKNDKIYERDPHLRSRTELFLKYSNGKCLEFGCGNGFLLQKISNKLPDYKHTGIDNNNDDILIAKSRKLKNITFINSDAHESTSGKYDTIILSHFLEHLIDPSKFMMQIKKNLNSNGKILIMVPNKNGFMNDAKMAPTGQKHFFIFDEDSIKFLLNQLGFFCAFKNTTVRIPFTRRICNKNKFISNTIFLFSKIGGIIFPSLSYDIFVVASVSTSDKSNIN